MSSFLSSLSPLSSFPHPHTWANFSFHRIFLSAAEISQFLVSVVFIFRLIWLHILLSRRFFQWKVWKATEDLTLGKRGLLCNFSDKSLNRQAQSNEKGLGSEEKAPQISLNNTENGFQSSDSERRQQRISWMIWKYFSIYEKVLGGDSRERERAEFPACETVAKDFVLRYRYVFILIFNFGVFKYFRLLPFLCFRRKTKISSWISFPRSFLILPPHRTSVITKRWHMHGCRQWCEPRQDFLMRWERRGVSEEFSQNPYSLLACTYSRLSSALPLQGIYKMGFGSRVSRYL